MPDSLLYALNDFSLTDCMTLTPANTKGIQYRESTDD